MILEFSIENYRSYKDKTTITFVADNALFNEDSVYNVTLSDEETKLRVLRFAGIFGPNASGKSNIVYAFEALNKLINESRKYSYQDPIDAYDPFLLDKECALKPTTFVLKFLCRRSVYKYKVSFDKRTILDEVLSKLNGKEEKQLFRATDIYRFKRRVEINDDLSKLVEIIGGAHIPLRNNHLFLSWLAVLPSNELTAISTYFSNLYTFSIHSDINLDINNIEAIAMLGIRPEKMMKRITKLMKIADIGVDSIDIQRFRKDAFRFPAGVSEDARNEFIDKNRYGIRFRHSSGTDSRTAKKFDISKESVGSKHLFNIGLKILVALSKGAVLAMDEMNLAIQPALFKFLVTMFKNPKANKNNAQLIFTTHDASIAGEEFMRADQIWFAEKKADGTSDLFSAIDFEGVSINTPFEMWYRTGRFGAVPRLSLIDDIFEDD